MKRSLSWFLIFFAALLMAAPVVAQHNKQIVGYYPNWQWYDRGQLVNPETLFYEKYTVINYAFFRPLADGSIESTDSWADENLLLGPMIWWPVQTHDSTRSLPYLAHQAGVKLLPSIGGWTCSENFPAISASPAKRQTFVTHCISLIQMYHFDGIDLDWEYPGYAPQGGTPDDKVNFTILLQELQTALDALGNQTGQDYLLTSCFGASADKMDNIEWGNVLPLLDMVNLMTYDFHGSWDAESNHHTPLYNPPIGNPLWCFDGAFTLLTETYNVPAEKVNLGIAFYGKALANCTQLYGSHTGYDGATFWEDEGQPLYYNILKRMDMFSYFWDDQVKCPYLLGTNINTFVTFDNTLSVDYKAQYVRDHNAGGIIIWEITGDYVETFSGSGIIQGTPLLDTIHQVFNESVGVPSLPQTSTIFVFPNPASQHLFITTPSAPTEVLIYNLNGASVEARFKDNRLDVSNLKNGMYLLDINDCNRRYQAKFLKK
jgi:chitinase